MKKYWIIRHPIKAFFLLLLAVPSVLGGLNYTGMCIPEGRWYSDEEMLRFVIESQYVKGSYGKTHDLNGNVSSYQRIKYNSYDHFMRENPDCCESGRHLSHKLFPNFLFQFNYGVIVKYKHLTRPPKINHDESESWYEVDNCATKAIIP